MANPASYPLTVRSGDTETITLTLNDDTGTAINITGRTYAAQIRETVDAASPLATFTCTITNAAAGQVACTLSAATTAALAAGVGVWDLQETYAGAVTTLLAGPARIEKDVTR